MNWFGLEAIEFFSHSFAYQHLSRGSLILKCPIKKESTRNNLDLLV